MRLSYRRAADWLAGCSPGTRALAAFGLTLAGVSSAIGVWALWRNRQLEAREAARRPTYRIPKNFEAKYHKSIVDEGSEESFPASDPPSWTPSHSGGPTR